ncbi:Ff.00g053400.m01.CDS01 [Fusarium sp. VM40]|nr:Ff.00g053400.m01.CDS01 [Fusarium sp. VM40]
MWMLLALVVHLAAAFPANWNETTACPRDALYTSLIEDGGGFCSSVLEGNHCGAGYSTPAEYCECILTTDAMTSSSNSSRTTARESSVTIEYSDSQSMDIETSASVGQPGSGRYTETSTTGVKSTTSGRGNGTRSTSASAGETTGDTPRTSPYTNTSISATETLSQGSTGSRNSWNFTTSGEPSDTRGPVSTSTSRIQNQTSSTQPSLSFTGSGNQSQTLQSSIGATSQPSDTHEPAMTHSSTTGGSLPRPIPGNSTSNASDSGTRPTGSTFTRWNSSLTIPSISISGTGSFVPFPTVPFPTISVSTGSEVSSVGSVVPGINGTTSASRGNDSIPTISVSRGSFVPFPTLSSPSQSSLEATSSGSFAPTWNSTSLPSGGNASVPTISIPLTETSAPIPGLPLPTESLTTDSGASRSVPSSWNSTTSALGGNLSIPTISISRTSTFVPFPTLPFPSESITTGSQTSGNQFPGLNGTASSQSRNLSIPTISISRTGSFVPFPTLPLPTESLSTNSGNLTSSAGGSSGVPGLNGTAFPTGGNVSVPTISLSQTRTSGPFTTGSLPSVSLPTVPGSTSSSTGSGSVVPNRNTTTGGSGGPGSKPTTSSLESGPVVSLPTDSGVLPSTTQSGDLGWNLTSSISGVVSVPTISVPTSQIPVPLPSLPFPTDSWEVSSSVESGTIVPGSNTTSSTPGNTGSVTSFSSPVATASTSGSVSNGSASGGNATTTGIPEFPAANFTHVTRTAALSEETCHSLTSDPDGGPTRRALLYNARLREDNVSIPIPYIESVEFEGDGVYPLYITVRDEAGGMYFVDISRRGQISVVDPAGYLVTLDAKGIHFSGSNCTYDISITIDDMYEQIADLAGVQCAAIKRRADDLNFRQVLYLHDQCGSVVDRSLRQYPQLLVGDTVCADVAVDGETGQWDFDCTFPGSQSGSLKCQWAIKNSIIDFITIDPFGGSCPDLSTVVTTLEESGKDIVDPSELRKDLTNQGLSTDRAKREADEAVIAYTQLWQALGAFFSKSTESSTGSLEEYIDVYNAHRSFENDICQSLHEGEIPLNLTLIAGASHIPALTTLNWAPESTRPYNITVQDSSRIACCPNGSVAEGEGSECAYPREAIIPGTGCVCGKSAGGVGIAFEWTECGNYAGSCEADGDCSDGYLCLTESCCGGGVCVDAYTCSENGTDLVQFDGVF